MAVATRASSKDVLTADELSNAFQTLQGLKPTLCEDADFDVENIKEVLLFVQFMWKNMKYEARGIAMAIAALVCFRHVCHGGEFEDVRYVDYLVFEQGGGPSPMLMKLHQKGFPKSMVLRKLEESKAALKYLQDVVSHWDDGSRVCCAFHAAYQVVADSFNYLTCYVSARDMGDGKLHLNA